MVLAVTAVLGKVARVYSHRPDWPILKYLCCLQSMLFSSGFPATLLPIHIYVYLFSYTSYDTAPTWAVTGYMQKHYAILDASGVYARLPQA